MYSKEKFTTMSILLTHAQKEVLRKLAYDMVTSKGEVLRIALEEFIVRNKKP